MAKVSKRSFGLLALAVGALVGGLVTAPAVQADNSPTVCATCHFTTIQAAIDVAAPGSTIRVGAGTYSGNLLIERSLSLVGVGESGDLGAGSSAPTIDGPVGVGPATITVNSNSGPITVAIRNLKITHGGSGIDVLQNAVMTVDKNTISGFDKNGITFGPYSLPGLGGISGTISNNLITGVGPTPAIAQNGIQVGEGNTAKVSNNHVSGLIYTGAGWVATGILVFGPGGNNSISNNSVDGVQNGIDVEESDHNTINGNSISGGSSNGMYLWNSSGNNISENKISGRRAPTSDAWGIALDGGTSPTSVSGSSNNSISANTVQTSDVGIWVGNGSNNNISTKNTLKGNSIGVQVDTYVGTYSTGVAAIGLQFHFNNFATNVLSFTNTTSVLTDATNNWWGNSSGPGTIAFVTTFPWCTNISCEKKSSEGDSKDSSHSGDKPAPTPKPSSEHKSGKTSHTAGAQD